VGKNQLKVDGNNKWPREGDRGHTVPWGKGKPTGKTRKKDQETSSLTKGEAAGKERRGGDAYQIRPVNGLGVSPLLTGVF